MGAEVVGQRLDVVLPDRLVQLRRGQHDVSDAPDGHAERQPVATRGLGSEPATRPYTAPLSLPNAQWVTLLTSRGALRGSSMSNKPSTSRLPTCAGAGASSQLFSAGRELPARRSGSSRRPWRCRANRSASMAAVPTAAARRARGRRRSGESVDMAVAVSRSRAPVAPVEDPAAFAGRPREPRVAACDTGCSTGVGRRTGPGLHGREPSRRSRP